MGQGSQSGTEGQHPAWSQMAQMGGAQLPDPMQRAREHFTNAGGNFKPFWQEFHGMEPGPEKTAARPEFVQERDKFLQARDWYQDLQGMTDGEARGMAAFGPPRPWEGPQTASMMEVPRVPGTQHDGTVQGLLSALQQQTASQIPGGGSGSGGAADGAAQQSPWRPAHELGIPYSRVTHPGTRAGGGSPVAPGSLFYRPKYEGDD